MKSDTRRARMAALIAEDEDDPIFELIKKQEEEQKAQEEINAEQSKSRDAEAVLSFLRNDYFVNRQCKNCETTFLTDYACVAYCSDACRKEALKKVGIEWDSTKPLHERWGKNIPLVIPEDILHKLLDRLNLTLKQTQVQELQNSPFGQDPAQ